MIPLWLLLFSLQEPQTCDALKKVKNPTSYQLVQKGHCTSDPIEATSFYHQASTVEAFAALGERHYLMGNYSVAIDYFKKALNTGTSPQPSKNIPAPKAMVPTTQATFEYWISLSHFAAGNKNESEKLLRKLYSSQMKICEVGLNCVNEDSETSRAPIVTSLARILEFKGHWTEATHLLDEYFAKGDSPSIRFILDLRLMLGYFYFRLQKTNKAYLQFARILRFYPQSAQAQWLRDHYAYREILKKYGSQVSSIQ